MKKYRSILITILIACSAICVSAQNKQERTSSAKAAYGRTAYGYIGETVKNKNNKKQKSEKHKKQHRNKVVKVTKSKSSREKGVADRRRSAWAG